MRSRWWQARRSVSAPDTPRRAAAITMYTDAEVTSALTQGPPDAQGVAVLLPELNCEHAIPGVSG